MTNTSKKYIQSLQKVYWKYISDNHFLSVVRAILCPLSSADIPSGLKGGICTRGQEDAQYGLDIITPKCHDSSWIGAYRLNVITGKSSGARDTRNNLRETVSNIFCR